MQQPPVPETRDLLPPLLSCLPSTFTSPNPPPALLPLLAPTLRQRVSYLSGSVDSPDGWIRLLNWDAQQAERLPSLVESLDLEPHPVSGELEIDDVRAVKYRRLDDETLQARLEVEQFNMLPIYVWCENDEHAQAGPGWRLTELKSMDDIEDGSTWYHDAAAANVAFMAQDRKASISAQPQTTAKDEDDDYWAAYDRQESETPAPEMDTQKTKARPGNTEEDYYSRYGEEVQPALDAHDPDEQEQESTLLGTQERGRPAIPALVVEDSRPAWERALYPHKAPQPHDSAVASISQSEINMPRPISPASSSRSSIERLEEQAAAMSDAGSGSPVELGIKQHISTDIKSLFRLAKTAGMTRSSFEQLIKRELDVLCMLDDD